MGGFAVTVRRPAVLVAAALASLVAMGGTPAAPAENWTFVQVQRVNSLTLQYGTDTFATQNAFGGAIGGVAQASMQTPLDDGVADGSITWLLEMPGLTDLSGTNNTSFEVGVLGGTPVSGAGYDGSSDLDWWYTPSAADLDPDGVPLRQLTATFTAKTLEAGPGPVVLNVSLAGQPASLAMSNTHVQAVAGDSSAPLESTNGSPPGHEPGENLPDSLTSFDSMTAGKLSAGISARSLANAPIPAGLLANCTAYTIAHTWLDLLVGGCKTAGGIITVVSQTQPDTVDPAVGSGTYAFTTDAGKHVTGCTHNGGAATLDECLDGAAYSSYFQFTADRVIDRSQVVVRPLLTVSRAGSGSGTVTSAPAGVDCGSDCGEAFDPGTEVTLTAGAAAGSTFAGWSGGGCSGVGTCTLTVNADTAVEATFTASAGDGGGDAGGSTTPTGTTGDGGTAPAAGTGDGTTPPADATPPAFGPARIAPRRVRRRATVTFDLSEAARVTYVFDRVVPGRRVGSRCVKPSRANARKRACHRFVRVARTTAAAVAGANKKVFARRIGRRRLKPGAYRLTLRATDAAGNRSQPKRLAFAVV